MLVPSESFPPLLPLDTPLTHISSLSLYLSLFCALPMRVDICGGGRIPFHSSISIPYTHTQYLRFRGGFSEAVPQDQTRLVKSIAERRDSKSLGISQNGNSEVSASFSSETGVENADRPQHMKHLKSSRERAHSLHLSSAPRLTGKGR